MLTITDLEERIAHLETTVRRWKCICVTGAVNDKVVPLEDVQKAIDPMRRATVP